MAGPEQMPRILHLFASFDADEPAPRRFAQVLERMGSKARHAIVSDDRDRRSAARLLPKAVTVSWPRFMPIRGSKLPGRLRRLADAMSGYDLLCTYGAGTLDAAFAHTLFADLSKLAPLVHHELDERGADGRRRGMYRRFALGRTAALIVPDAALEAIALDRWDQPRTRVRLIREGIDTRAFVRKPARDAIPGLVKRRDELWLGTIADSLGANDASGAGQARTELPGEAGTLLDGLQQMTPQWQLVVAGEPHMRTALDGVAAARGIEDRLHFAPPAAPRADLFALFDALVLTSRRQQHMGLVMEAMAAGLPIVLPRDCQSANLVASDSAPLLLDRQSTDMAAALTQLATDPELRRRIASANRKKARETFDVGRMADATWALYRSLIARAPASVGLPKG